MANTQIKSYLVPGPLVSAVNRTQAEEGFRGSPAILELSKTANVDYTIQEVEGRWIASVAAVQKTAEFPPSPSPDDDAGPPSDGPSPDGPPSDSGSDGPPSDDGGSDGPPSGDDGGEKKEKKKDGGGEKHELGQLLQIVQALATALGVPIPGADPTLDPNADPSLGAGGPPGGPPGAGGPPPGLGGPPPGAGGPPPGPGPDAKAKHPMHPGDVPPGGTPLGAPAFSSVREDNPFAHLAGTTGSFKVNEPLGTWTMDQAQAELRSLAAEAGFNVKRVSEVRDPDTGERRIVASLSVY
jgi:hypothetical protein